MFRYLPLLLTLAYFIYFGLVATADATPIRDGLLQSHDAGWFRSDGEYCHTTCEGIRSSTPEYNRLNAGSVGGTFLCKAYDRVGGGYVFGNVFYEEGMDPTCAVLNSDGSLANYDVYFCLCVDR